MLLRADELRQRFISSRFGSLWGAAVDNFDKSAAPSAGAFGATVATKGKTKNAAAAAPAAPFPAFAIGGAAAVPPLFAPTPAAAGGGGGTLWQPGTAAAAPGATSGDSAQHLWPYYKLWLEHHWRKKMKQDAKAKSDAELVDDNARRECLQAACV